MSHVEKKRKFHAGDALKTEIRETITEYIVLKKNVNVHALRFFVECIDK